jgi:hypothetical protein
LIAGFIFGFVNAVRVEDQQIAGGQPRRCLVIVGSANQPQGKIADLLRRGHEILQVTPLLSRGAVEEGKHVTGVSEEQISRFGRETAQKGGGELDAVFVPKEGLVEIAYQFRLIPEINVFPQNILQTDSRGAYFLAVARNVGDHHTGNRSVAACREVIEIAAALGRP